MFLEYLKTTPKTFNQWIGFKLKFMRNKVIKKAFYRRLIKIPIERCHKLLWHANPDNEYRLCIVEHISVCIVEHMFLDLLN